MKVVGASFVLSYLCTVFRDMQQCRGLSSKCGSKEKMKKSTLLNPSEIRNFNHPVFGKVRTIAGADGSVLFVAKDVAEALGYSNTSKAIQQHVNLEDKSTLPIREAAYETRAIIINESGLYSLILSSKLDSARAFKHWVTNEVLPQIRQTGGYIPLKNSRTGEVLTEAEIVEAANKVMQRTISHKNLPADDCLTTSEIAKLYGMETKDLNHLLVDKGVQFWNGARYKLTEAYAGNDYGKLRKFHYYALDGEKKERCYLVWTPKGAEMINKMMKMKE